MDLRSSFFVLSALVGGGLVACGNDDSVASMDRSSSPTEPIIPTTPTPPATGANSTAGRNAQGSAGAGTTTPVTTTASDAGVTASDAGGAAPSGPCFTVRDLGLGYVAIAAINHRGQMIANPETSVAAGTPVHALFIDGTTQVELPTLGGPASNALAVSEGGIVVGQANLADANTWHATRWDNGVVADLGTLPGGNTSTAYAIAENGDIVGTSSAPDGTEHAVLWRSGAIVDLGRGAGVDGGYATFVNEQHQILGSSVFGYGDRGAVMIHSLFWNDATTAIELAPPNLGAATMTSHGLNASGAAVVTVDADGRGGTGWLWNAGTFTAITPFADAAAVTLAGINDSGYVAGDAMRGATGPFGFLWKNGATTAIASPLGDAMRVEHLNAQGQVIGEALEGSEFRAFTWKDGTFVYLTDETVWSATTAMNDQGQVAVLTGLGNDAPHSSLLFDTSACFHP